MSTEASRRRSGTVDHGPVVMTVLGPVEPAALGYIQTHEHLLCDLSVIIGRTKTGPVFESQDDPDPDPFLPELTASERRMIAAPIVPETYDWIRRNVVNFANLQLLDEREAIGELGLYAAAGGGALVESTVIGLGRDPEGLARISRATGVHVIMGAGFYTRDYHPRGLDAAAPEQIRDFLIAEIEGGVGATGIRPGVIGEIGLSSPMARAERRVLMGAVEAQKATGLPLQIHPGRSPEAPLEAIRVVQDAGGDPSRTVIAHIDRTLTDAADMIELARTGCYLEFDLFGQESSYYALSDVDRPNDAQRIAALAELTSAGFGDRLVIAQDICQRVYLRRYGGPGYTHILENVLPVMRRKGWGDDDIDQITRANPAALLTIAGS